MDIFLSVNNRAEIIQLPIVPSEFKIKSPVNNETFTTINQGDIKLFGESGLKAIVIDAFFPSKDYPFARSNQYKGWEYVKIIESWKERKLRVRLVATGTPINMVFAIDDFVFGPQDGSGDIYYSLSLEEFKDIKLQKKAITPESKPTIKKSNLNTGSPVKKKGTKKKAVKKKAVRKKPEKKVK
ncbi:hypothetical protein [Sporosarcina cyprini]|uniref:hypothetical protein n=1 Tax=Sporosarcina cyprini TaxID=2910523 RepID=UPI001EDFD726|nr:hypothetical protein [Sporosarcina cyprini]MCG3089128.1 hypothetical protein [Sporosarcina cyprini]